MHGPARRGQKAILTPVIKLYDRCQRLGQPATPPPAAAPSVGSQISSHAQKSLGSYALLAIAREPFELCPHFKSPPSVARRELSIDLTWVEHRPETQNPPLLSCPRTSRVLGEGGVN